MKRTIILQVREKRHLITQVNLFKRHCWTRYTSLRLNPINSFIFSTSKGNRSWATYVTDAKSLLDTTNTYTCNPLRLVIIFHFFLSKTHVRMQNFIYSRVSSTYKLSTYRSHQKSLLFGSWVHIKIVKALITKIN